jgi:hypothetical protein
MHLMPLLLPDPITKLMPACSIRHCSFGSRPPGKANEDDTPCAVTTVRIAWAANGGWQFTFVNVRALAFIKRKKILHRRFGVDIRFINIAVAPTAATS